MKQSRNEKCNCGSGKKFKHCCQKNEQSNQTNQYLTTFGAYYKDDTLDGFSFAVMGYERAKHWYDMINLMTSTELESLKKDGKTFDSKECFKHLEDSIKYWNLHTIGSEKRKEKDFIANVNLNDENIFKATLCIMQDIHILTELGYIKNDNYNGMAYGYSPEKYDFSTMQF